MPPRPEAVRRGLRIVYPRTDEPRGVHRFFVEDPSGTIVNVPALRALIVTRRAPHGDNEPRTAETLGYPAAVHVPEHHVVAAELVRAFDVGTAAEVVALDRVSVQIAAGSFVALAGPSGSGKSTLLYLIGAMDRPSAGELFVLGRALHGLPERALGAHRREVGFVFQRFNLLPQLTARDNVLLPLLSGRVGAPERARADELLEAVGLLSRRDALPSQLSGGQQQRVAIARALMREPRLLLADEPTGNLDSATGAEVLDLLAQLRERRELTVVLATHDAVVAERSDRVLALRDGALVADVATEDRARVRELLRAGSHPETP